MNNKLLTVLNKPSDIVAPRLLGCLLIREIGNQKIIVRIVETEAYTQTDEASHTFRGQTPRNEVMFGPAGHLYVYFTYGMHYCCNVVCGPVWQGSAVLIRAVEPLVGEEILSHNRQGKIGEQMTNGPAKLCQALKIDKSLNSHDLTKSPLMLNIEPAIPEIQIIQTTRIGISKAREVAWRFYLKNNKYVSRPL